MLKDNECVYLFYAQAMHSGFYLAMHRSGPAHSSLTQNVFYKDKAPVLASLPFPHQQDFRRLNSGNEYLS